MAKVKKIRFPLEMKNGIAVRTLEELKENFLLEKILMYISNGKLQIWLRDRYLDDIAEALLQLKQDDEDYEKKVCNIFEVEYDEKLNVDLASTMEKQRKLSLLKEYTDDENYVDYIDQMAFEQDDLDDLLDAGITTIYLCGEKFLIPISKKGIRYIGVNEAIAVIYSKEKVDFEEKNVSFENVKFDEIYREILNECEKQEVKDRQRFGEYVENTYTKLFMKKQEVDASKITYGVLAERLEKLVYDPTHDTKSIMDYLLSSGVEDLGTDYLIGGGDTYIIRNYLENSGLENMGVYYLENS